METIVRKQPHEIMDMPIPRLYSYGVGHNTTELE